MIRYEAHIATSTSAAFETIWTFGSKRWMVALAVKLPLVSKSLVLRTKSNQTLSRSPTLSLSNRTTMLDGCSSGAIMSRTLLKTTSSDWISPNSWSICLLRRGRHRAGENPDQGACDLDPDRPDHDALDPLLGRQGRFGFHRGDLPDEREDESQRTDRADQRLADVDPGSDQIRNRRDVRVSSEKQHSSLLWFCSQARGATEHLEPRPLREDRHGSPVCAGSHL